jgi:hypothetical protein
MTVLRQHTFDADASGRTCRHPGCGLPPSNAIHLDIPLLPYDGTQGYAGSATSEGRARADVTSGTARDRQHLVLAYLDGQQAHGATVKEIREHFGWHHGQASSVLSTLHKGNPAKGQDPRIDRLAEVRDGCEVYVLPEHVNGRETRQHGRVTPTWTDAERRALDSLEAALRTGAAPAPEDLATVLAGARRLDA